MIEESSFGREGSLAPTAVTIHLGLLVKKESFFRDVSRFARSASKAVAFFPLAAGRFLIDEVLAAVGAKAMTGIPLMFFKALLGCNDLTARAAFDIVYVANMLLECSFIDEVFRAQMAVAMPGTALMCLKTFANRESLLAGVAGMSVDITAMIVERFVMDKRPVTQHTETVS